MKYTFLFLNACVESVCLEKRMAKHREIVSGANLRDPKEKRDQWRREQINVRKKNIKNDMERTSRNWKKSIIRKGKEIKEIYLTILFSFSDQPV